MFNNFLSKNMLFMRYHDEMLPSWIGHTQITRCMLDACSYKNTLKFFLPPHTHTPIRTR